MKNQSWDRLVQGKPRRTIIRPSLAEFHKIVFLELNFVMPMVTDIFSESKVDLCCIPKEKRCRECRDEYVQTDGGQVKGKCSWNEWKDNDTHWKKVHLT